MFALRACANVTTSRADASAAGRPRLLVRSQCPPPQRSLAAPHPRAHFPSNATSHAAIRLRMTARTKRVPPLPRSNQRTESGRAARSAVVPTTVPRAAPPLRLERVSQRRTQSHACCCCLTRSHARLHCEHNARTRTKEFAGRRSNLDALETDARPATGRPERRQCCVSAAHPGNRLHNHCSITSSSTRP